MAELPVIDVAPLIERGAARASVAEAIDAACREHGFFYVVGHGVDPRLEVRLDAAAREFFALDDEEKAAISMARGGRAWRGWFPVGGELTSGVPDHKEGIYFGEELDDADPRVRASTPLHGANLFPARPAALRAAVLDHMAAMTGLGHVLMKGIALALGVEEDWFAQHLTATPLTLFRIFHYPPSPGGPGWGVGEHTDYGLLTILLQDRNGGLEVRTPGGWVDAPPVPGSYVCNLGDMLERMTAGRYRSTPHRVRPSTGAGRLSYPFFFDPGWDAEVRPVPVLSGEPMPPPPERWDGVDLTQLSGAYGAYLLGKVAKVFPELRDEVLRGDG